MRAKEFQRPTLKRKIGYQDEGEEDKEDNIPDMTRMKVDHERGGE